MEEAKEGQKPEQDRPLPAGRPEPATGSVGGHDPQDEDEKRFIRDGQEKAKHDEAEMRRAGFGHHIGSE